MRILVIEDNADHSELIKIALSGTYQVDTLTCLAEIPAKLEGNEYNAIICDLSLPDGDGLQNIEFIRRQDNSIPLVVLTCLDDDLMAMDALHHGAQDYLVKSEALNPLSARHTLDRAIRYSIQRQQLVLEKEKLLLELKQSKDELTQKNQNLSAQYETAHRYVDNVSHEFRTPLTVIKSYSSIIRDAVVGEVNEEQQKMLGIIEDRADDLNTMVDDMLDVSKLEAGLVGLCRTKCSVNDIITNVMPALERKADVRNTKLTVNLPEDLPSVWCDREKIGRVIINLAVNAIKFSGEPGEVNVDVQLDDVNQEVVFSVCDNGNGIPNDQLEAIFERFEQNISNVKHKVKGFGLGLAIANELVELNFGKISVTSQENVGSQFSFTIPVADPTEIVKRQIDFCTKQAGVGNAKLQIVDISIEATEKRDIDDTALFLEQHITGEDQMFPLEPGHWLLLRGNQNDSKNELGETLESSRQRFSRNRPAGPLPKLKLEFHETFTGQDTQHFIEAFRQRVATQEECYA